MLNGVIVFATAGVGRLAFAMLECPKEGASPCKITAAS